MTDTVQEQIIAAFTARAAALSGLPVERARRSYDAQLLELEHDVFVSIWDKDETLIGPSYYKDMMAFNVDVNCVWNVFDDNPSQSVMSMKGLVIHTLIGPGLDRTFGGLCKSCEYLSETHAYPADGQSNVALIVTFKITYATVAGDPYTAA